jgi:hypothetical protein
MKKAKLICVPCNCQRDQSIGGRHTKTEWYDEKAAAVKAVVSHVINANPYWCVHLQGKHVTSVRVGGVWYGGFDKNGNPWRPQ